MPHTKPCLQHRKQSQSKPYRMECYCNIPVWEKIYKALSQKTTYMAQHIQRNNVHPTICRNHLSFPKMRRLEPGTRYINLKRAVLAAIYKKEGDTANSKRLMAFSLSNECSSWKKLLLHFAFNYTACGGRGIHWLIAPLI